MHMLSRYEEEDAEEEKEEELWAILVTGCKIEQARYT